MKYSAHHVLFYRKRFNKGYAHRLRKAFVYEIPDDMHIKLHQIVGPAPEISDDEARNLYIEYKRLDHELSSEFAIAMMAQLGFVQNYEAFRHN